MTSSVPLVALVLVARGAPAPPEPLAAVAWARPERVPEAAPEPPRAWADRPVARELHPVAFHYGRRYQELLEGLMGGPRASPVFGPVVAEADVHWRLLDATGRGLPLDADKAQRWWDTSLAGGLLAVERLLDETVERAPTLYGVYVAGDTLLSPSFDVRRGDDEALVLVHRPGGAAARSVERREEELAMGQRRGRPSPSVGAGLDWELRDEEAPETSPLVRYTAWLATTEIAVSSLRLEVAPENLAWTVSARQALAPRLFAIGSARSDERGPPPARLQGGLMWVPPLPGSCNVRAERIVELLVPDERWMLTLRCENRTRIPAPLSPPLGDRGREGPTLPWAPERGPIPVAPTARTEVVPTSGSGAPR